MGPLPQTLETLARLGVHLDISEHDYLPQTLETLVRLVAHYEGHITINASKCLPATLENLARIGRTHITFRF
ncbi:hypothetical protein UA19_01920 [Burkholderia multivorans]|nr:hypothetical protein NP80_1428 [Burkholderia multivorans ATCC BAA-247]SAK18573.1 hypothetical protein UA19_01920 [Burkholderia multivorans]SAK18793.1 hypothetical protein UA21_01980 [Burkholderia multivorans]SPV04203.1 Uncharacterised protein [Burkholderia multivorans]